MDTLKIGNFLKSLRKERNLTQEELAEKIGTTYKTISRWETGLYLPPVEMLQVLSNFYNVSINEILSGERLDGKNYKEVAERTLLETVRDSKYEAENTKRDLQKKWIRSHLVELIPEFLLIYAIGVVCFMYAKEILFAVLTFAFLWSFLTYHRLNTFVNKKLYGNDRGKKKRERQGEKEEI